MRWSPRGRHGGSSVPVLPKAEVTMHIREHLKYPAARKQLVDACNKMADVPAADRAWFDKNLPDRTYKTADEVIKALKL